MSWPKYLLDARNNGIKNHQRIWYIWKFMMIHDVQLRDF